MTLARILVALSLTLTAAGAALVPVPSTEAADAAKRSIPILVDHGYQPSRIVVHEGERVRLEIVRKDYSPCAAELVIPSLGLRRQLPVNEVVLVDLPALAPGEVDFHCGMNMIRGTIVVEARR